MTQECWKCGNTKIVFTVTLLNGVKRSVCEKCLSGDVSGDYH